MVNLRLPAVYGSELRGKLRHLSRLPVGVRDSLLRLVGAIHPVVSVPVVVKNIISLAGTNSHETVSYIADPKRRELYFVLKRVADLIGATCLTILLGWLFPIIWVLVKLESGGAGLVTERLVGKNRHEFDSLKFRVTKTDVTADNSNSLTRVGSLLRKTKLEKLPQLINIFNNLSLIHI